MELFIILVELLGRYSNRGDLTRALNRLGELPRVAREQTEPRTHHRFVDEEMELALVEGYASGASTYELGRTFGLHRQRVSAILIRNGVTTRFRVITDEMLADMRAMLDAGDSKAAIARHFGVARSSVSRVLQAGKG